MKDARKILEEEQPFTYRLTKDGKAFVSCRGKVVSTLVGKDYQRLLTAIDSGDELAIQHVLARATGHFKHGNER